MHGIVVGRSIEGGRIEICYRTMIGWEKREEELNWAFPILGGVHPHSRNRWGPREIAREEN